MNENIKATLVQLNAEFKSLFPNVNLDTIKNHDQNEKIDNFVNQKLQSILPMGQEPTPAQIKGYVDLVAETAPEIYAFGKADCVIDALRYEMHRSVIGKEIVEKGIFGIDSPEDAAISIDYFSGKSFSISSTSSSEEWSNYLQGSFKECAEQFSKPTVLDSELESFKTEIAHKIEEYAIARAQQECDNSNL